MSFVKVNYAGMQTAHDSLVATWSRIESHLVELDAVVATTNSMRADTLQAYYLLKSQWDLAALDRQITLQALAMAVAQASEQYRLVDQQAAAMFMT